MFLDCKMFSLATGSLVTAVIILFYVWMKHRYGHWSRKGVKFIKPVPIFGTMLSMLTRTEPFVVTLEVS
jgi:hypothetical protein